MRRDMDKVIVERPRVGGHGDRPGRKPRDAEDLPARQSIRRAHSDRKHLNDNLGPLKRFLISAAGRPWNDVYSEISEHIKGDSTVQRHILQHVFQYVHLHVTVEGKKVFDSKSRYHYRHELWGDELYVDPDSGLLKRYKAGKNRRFRTAKVNEFEQILNSFSDPKSRTVVKDGKVFKVYKNRQTLEWTVINSATPAHARLDFGSGFKRDHLSWFFKKCPQTEKSDEPYFQELWNLWGEYQAREEEVRRHDAERTIIHIGDQVQVRRGEEWQHGVVNKIVNGHKKYYDVTMDDGSVVSVDMVGSHDKIKKVT